jgi:hypothetical protein
MQEQLPLKGLMAGLSLTSSSWPAGEWSLGNTVFCPSDKGVVGTRDVTIVSYDGNVTLGMYSFLVNPKEKDVCFNLQHDDSNY